MQKTRDVPLEPAPSGSTDTHNSSWVMRLVIPLLYVEGTFPVSILILGIINRLDGWRLTRDFLQDCLAYSDYEKLALGSLLGGSLLLPMVLLPMLNLLLWKQRWHGVERLAGMLLGYFLIGLQTYFVVAPTPVFLHQLGIVGLGCNIFLRLFAALEVIAAIFAFIGLLVINDEQFGISKDSSVNGRMLCITSFAAIVAVFFVHHYDFTAIPLIAYLFLNFLVMTEATMKRVSLYGSKV